MTYQLMPVPSEGGSELLLPPDYDSLTSEGRRQARVNAASQWIFDRPPAQRAEAAVACYRFFQAYYLRDDPEVGFQAGFFDDEPLPTPPFHYDIVAANAVHPLVVVGAPRGSAKSTVGEISRLLKIITRPLYSVEVATASNRLARRWGTRAMLQIINNARLNDDFRPEYNGRLRGPRGIAFGAEMLYLENGSWLSFTTTGSRMRGERAWEFDLDDPEYDPDGESTDMARLRNETETMVFKVILPKVLREGRRLTWRGTLISRRHFLCKAFGDRMKAGFDNRFEYWHRMLLSAVIRLPDGTEESLWPEMWSRENLEVIKGKLGMAQYRSEMLNEPGASDDSYFFLEEGRHSYTIEDHDAYTNTEPFRSEATIHFQRKGESISLPLREFLAKSSVFVTVDSAPTSSETSDYNAIAVLACTPFNELFVLDIFNRKVKEHITALQALRFADKWHASVIAVELHSKSQGVYGSLQHLLGTRAEGIDPLTHLPALRPLKVGYASKTARISGLQFRFGDPDVKDPTIYSYGGLIKFPLNQRGRSIEWNALFDQIEEFNPDATDGGLAHDDALDSVSMSQDVLVGLKRKPVGARPVETPLDLLKQGKTKDQAGNVLAYMVEWNNLPRDDMQAVLAAAEKRQKETHAKRSVV